MQPAIKIEATLRLNAERTRSGETFITLESFPRA
jgi:hypothetical protein